MLEGGKPPWTPTRGTRRLGCHRGLLMLACVGSPVPPGARSLPWGPLPAVSNQSVTVTIGRFKGSKGMACPYTIHACHRLAPACPVTVPTPTRLQLPWTQCEEGRRPLREDSKRDRSGGGPEAGWGTGGLAAEPSGGRRLPRMAKLSASVWTQAVAMLRSLQG